jgi:hypothetical protein
MITGKCFCGAIQYRIESNILKSGVCHCQDCQRLTSGAGWSFIIVPKESLVAKGETKEFVRQGASGKPARISFCGICGTTLFGKPEIWPHIVTVSASSLDDQSHFSPDMHVWTKDAPKWFIFDPEIQKFDCNPM